LRGEDLDNLSRCQRLFRFPYDVEKQAGQMAAAKMVHPTIGTLWTDSLGISVGIENRQRCV
jgi:hypothetical protein